MMKMGECHCLVNVYLSIIFCFWLPAEVYVKIYVAFFPFSEIFDKTVATLLIGMNMGQYLHLFKDADVGLNLFLTLTEDDLEVLGVPDKNHRKDIAHGIANIRKKKKGDNSMRGLQDDIADSTLT